MAALLTSVADNKDKSAVYLSECRQLGIKVLAPDVNESSLRFAAVGTDIRFGLGGVRNVGANVVDSIIETRTRKGKYASFADFVEKSELVCCNKRVLESLIKAGAFDSFGHSRKALADVHEDAVDAVTGLKRQQAMGQFDLFGDGDAETESSSPLAHLSFEAAEWPRDELLGLEREMLGLYVSGHPLDGADHLLRKHAPKPIAALLANPPRDGTVTIAGMISALERRVNKKGESWAIAVIEDLDAAVEVLFFPKSYSVFAAELMVDAVVVVEGRVNWREDKLALFGAHLAALDLAHLDEHRRQAPLMLEINARNTDRDSVRELKSVLLAHPGGTPVHLALCYRQRRTMLAIEDYPVTVSPALLGELRAVRGVKVLT